MIRKSAAAGPDQFFESFSPSRPASLARFSGAEPFSLPDAVRYLREPLPSSWKQPIALDGHRFGEQRLVNLSVVGSEASLPTCVQINSHNNMTTKTSSHSFANAFPSEFASFTDRLAKLGEDYTTHRTHIPSVFAQLDDEEFADIARKIGMSPTDLTMLPSGSYSAGQLISDIIMAGPLRGTPTITLATCAKVRSLTEAEGGALSWIFQFLLTSDRSDLQRLRAQRYLDGYIEFFQNRIEEPKLLSQLGSSFSGRAPWLSALLKRFETATLAELLFCLDYSAEELGSCASDSAGRDLSDVLEFRFETEPQALKLDRFIVGAPVIDSAKKDALCSMLSGLNAQQGEALRWLLQFLIAAGFVDVAACESKWRNLDYIEGFVTGAQHAYSNTPEEVHVLD